MVPITETSISAFVAALPVTDAGHGNRPLFQRAVAGSRASASLCDEDGPVALLGVMRDGRAWMHSLPAFRAPFEAFRLIRRQFRAWAQDGDVTCELHAAAGRPVRIMGLIQKTVIWDGRAKFVLRGGQNVH